MRKALIIITLGLIIEIIGGIADAFRHLAAPFEVGWHDFLAATSHQIIALGFVVATVGLIVAWRIHQRTN